MKAPACLRINVMLERVADPALYDHLAQFPQRRRAEQLRGLAHDGVLSRNRWLSPERSAPEPRTAARARSPGTLDDASPKTPDRGIAHAAIDLFADPLAEP